MSLAADSALIISDSGGVQEEASVLGRPVVVVRRSTERPEALGDFAELVSPGPEVLRAACRLLDDIDAVHQRLGALPSPFGDGGATRRCEEVLRALVPGL
ncbi:UDP-N-acetylglucosamine 2-epimerase [Catenulispora yoronensis]